MKRKNYCNHLYKKRKKGNLGQKIKSVEKNELLQNDQEIANELSTIFKNTA